MDRSGAAAGVAGLRLAGGYQQVQCFKIGSVCDCSECEHIQTIIAVPYRAGKRTMQAKSNSWALTAKVSMDQLEAMGSKRFDIGVKRSKGTMQLREEWGEKQVLKAILWLRRENLYGAHIYIRPTGVHGLSLVDDLTADDVKRMKANGFEPAVVVETSTGNFQAWLKHGQVLDEATATYAAKELARRFGGDPSSADWRHFGRLAGFTNPKPSRRLQSGMQPFARLHEATGKVYTQALDFVRTLRAEMERKTGEFQTAEGEGAKERGLRRLMEFHGDAHYGGDLHRADMAWAKHAAGHGLTVEEIRDTILGARDLSHKGGLKRQREYAERTAEKAVRQIRE